MTGWQRLNDGKLGAGSLSRVRIKREWGQAERLLDISLASRVLCTITPSVLLPRLRTRWKGLSGEIFFLGLAVVGRRGSRGGTGAEGRGIRRDQGQICGETGMVLGTGGRDLGVIF